MNDNGLTKRTSTNSIYNQYISNAGKKSSRSIFESKTAFRDGFSKYDMSRLTVEAGSDCKYDPINCSGVPVDYDSTAKILYVDGSDSHTLLIGATGSKKSRLFVMPTVRILASSNESMIICDPKGEVYNRTASFLKTQGYNIHVINLREPLKGDGWNLLAIPYKHYLENDIDKACALVNDATINLIPIQDSKDPYWDYSARDMLFGLVLLLFKIGKEFSFEEKMINVKTLLQLRGELFSTTNKNEILRGAIWEYAKEDSLIRSRLQGIVNCPDVTLSCIISVFDQHMSCFSLQPQVANLLSETTFDIGATGFGKEATFLIMPDEKTTYHKIITIFLKQLYELLIDNAYKKTKDNRFEVRVNFILDEFSSLPAISDFPQMITASRSRNLRFVLVAQSKHQLKQRYEYETDTIMSNCSNWLFLTSREIELLKEISLLSGIKNDRGDPLVSISDLQHFNKDVGECLIFSNRKNPYIAYLPDIKVYDEGKFDPIEMIEIEGRKTNEQLSSKYFSKLLRKKKLENLLAENNTDVPNKSSGFDSTVSSSSRDSSDPFGLRSTILPPDRDFPDPFGLRSTASPPDRDTPDPFGLRSTVSSSDTDSTDPFGLRSTVSSSDTDFRSTVSSSDRDSTDSPLSDIMDTNKVSISDSSDESNKN